jgi:hypothetical protein
VSEALLESDEEALRSRQAKCHGAQFAQYLVPRIDTLERVLGSKAKISWRRYTWWGGGLWNAYNTHPRTSLRVAQVPSPLSRFLMMGVVGVLYSDRNTESSDSNSDHLTWRRHFEFPCTIETKSWT